MNGVDIKDKLKRAYFLGQCSRKIIFVGVALFFNEEPQIAQQLCFNFLVNLLTILFVGKSEALIGRDINQMDMMNESFLTFIFYSLAAFTDFTQNQYSKLFASWSINFLILLMLVLNMVPIMIESLKLFKILVKKYSRLHCYRFINYENKNLPQFLFKIKQLFTGRVKTKNELFQMELVHQINLKILQKRANFQENEAKILYYNQFVMHLKQQKNQQDQQNTYDKTFILKMKEQAESLLKDVNIGLEAKLQLEGDQIPKNLNIQLEMIQNLQNETNKCELMEAMGFYLKVNNWQDQYKKRKRIAQRKLPISNKNNRLKLNLTEIKEQPKENKTSQIKELSNLTEEIQDQEEKKYQEKINELLETIIQGDDSIFKIYDPFKPPKTNRDESNNLVPNILKVDFDKSLVTNSQNQKIIKDIKCIQDLMNQPTLIDPAFSLFRDFVKKNQAAIFEQKFFYPNWKENQNLEDQEYQDQFLNFRDEYLFLLEHAIRNDDSAKDKLAKMIALTYLLDWSCQKFINQATKNQKCQDEISFIEAQRNTAAKELYKTYVLNK